MARKQSPASLERKKLREKRERASALAAQSSVKADKKQTWWCKRFQDGYEIKLTDIDKYCMGLKQQNELYALVSPFFQD